MSTRLIHMLVEPLLGRFGGAILRAAVAESDRADAAELNEAEARGALREARDNVRYSRHERDEAHDELVEKNDRIQALEHEIETLRSEAESARVDDECAAFNRETVFELRRFLKLEDDYPVVMAVNSLYQRAHSLERESEELKRRCDRLTDGTKAWAESFAIVHNKFETEERDRRAALRERDEALADAARFCNALDTVTAHNERLENDLTAAKLELHIGGESVLQGGRRCGEFHTKLDAAGERIAQLEQGRDSILRARDEAIAMIADMQRNPEAPAEASVPCAWCLVETGHVRGFGLPLCQKCYDDAGITWGAVDRRASMRSDSCPTRRTSPDPLAVACANCGVCAGVNCHVVPF